MANRSSKTPGKSQGSESSMSNRTDPSQGTDAQSCPTPGERRDSSISSDDEEEE